MEEHEMAHLREKHKKSPVAIPRCFTGAQPHHRRRSSFDSASSSSSSHPWRTPSAWIKSKAIYDFPEIKGKCHNFMISRTSRHRRHSSADFSYDPLSYALNFHDDAASEDDEYLNFTARLPLSPPRRTITPATSTPSDHHNLPRTVPIPKSPSRETVADDMRRGLEAVSVASSAKEQQRSVEAEEEVTSPAVGISSTREVLVQLC